MISISQAEKDSAVVLDASPVEIRQAEEYNFGSGKPTQASISNHNVRAEPGVKNAGAIGHQDKEFLDLPKIEVKSNQPDSGRGKHSAGNQSASFSSQGDQFQDARSHFSEEDDDLFHRAGGRTDEQNNGDQQWSNREQEENDRLKAEAFKINNVDSFGVETSSPLTKSHKDSPNGVTKTTSSKKKV